MGRRRDGQMDGRMDMSPAMKVTGPGQAFPDAPAPPSSQPRGCSHPIAHLAPSVPMVSLTHPPGHCPRSYAAYTPHLATHAWRLCPWQGTARPWEQPGSSAQLQVGLPDTGSGGVPGHTDHSGLSSKSQGSTLGLRGLPQNPDPCVLCAPAPLGTAAGSSGCESSPASVTSTSNPRALSPEATLTSHQVEDLGPASKPLQEDRCWGGGGHRCGQPRLGCTQGAPRPEAQGRWGGCHSGGRFWSCWIPAASTGENI